MTLNVWEASPDAVTIHDGYDGMGAPLLSTFTRTEVREAISTIARNRTGKVRMPSNGSPVLHESDLIEMRSAMQRAEHKQRVTRLTADVAALLAAGNVPDSDAREPDQAPPEEGSHLEQDGAAADDFYGSELPRDEAGWGI